MERGLLAATILAPRQLIKLGERCPQATFEFCLDGAAVWGGGIMLKSLGLKLGHGARRTR